MTHLLKGTTLAALAAFSGPALALTDVQINLVDAANQPVAGLDVYVMRADGSPLVTQMGAKANIYAKDTGNFVTVMLPMLDSSIGIKLPDPDRNIVTLEVSRAKGFTGGVEYRFLPKTPPQFGSDPGGPTIDDDCTFASPIAPGTSLTFDNSLNTTDPLDPPYSCHFSGPTTQGFGTTWFSFISDGSDATFDTVGSLVSDTLIAVYSGDCATPVEIACNDDIGGGIFLSSVTATGLTSGDEYLVQVSSWSATSLGTITLNFAGAPTGPTPNDDCAMAEPIAPGDAVTFDNSSNTTDLADPPYSCHFSGPTTQGFGTTWFSFVSDGTDVTFDTLASAVSDTLIAVYSGDCSTPVEIACNDDVGGGVFLSEMTATGLTSGDTYLVQVSSWSATSLGEITLTMTGVPPGPTANDDCSMAEPVAVGASVTFDNSLNTTDPLDPPYSCHFSGPTTQGFGTTWFSFVADSDEVLLDTALSDVSDTLLAVYSGDCSTPVEIACNDDIGGGVLLSEVLATGLTVGDTYLVQVASWSTANLGSLTLTVTSTLVPTANDDCSMAEPVAIDSSITFDNSLNTTDPSDPPYSCHFSGPTTQGFGTTWFSFVADSDEVLLDTALSAVSDTLLAVYSGDCLTPVEIACNDDIGGGNFLSEVTATGLTVGDTYLVQVASWNELNLGSITLTVSSTLEPTPNDDCSMAELIAVGSSVTFDNSLNTTDPLDPPYSCHFSGPTTQGFGTTWFSFVADNTTVLLDTNDSAVGDTLLAVYSGDCITPVEIACNDDNLDAGDFRSEVIASGLTVGDTYLVQVASWSLPNLGSITLDVASTLPLATKRFGTGINPLDLTLDVPAIIGYSLEATISPVTEMTQLFVTLFPDEYILPGVGEILLAPPIILISTSPDGSHTAAIPDTAALVGITIPMQGLELPMGSKEGTGINLSNAVDFTFGDF